jgi:Fe2+ transport system protein FeoA
MRDGRAGGSEGAVDGGRAGCVALVDAPRNTPLRVDELLGGENVRRRLLSMGFHKDDLIELDSQAIMRGPVLVRNLTSGTRVALGRGVAQKILVEVVHERT